MTRTRRAFLASAAATAASAVTLGTVSAQETAFDPDDVTIEWDYDWLQQYRPGFKTTYQTMQRSNGLYAYRATSKEYEYDVACYWHRLTHQDGLPMLSPDSHNYDHEPCYVFVNDSGNVEEVAYTHFHHFADVLEGEALSNALLAHETGDTTHVPLEIISPWHHYTVRSDLSEDDLVWVDVEDTEGVSFLDTWTSRGAFESTQDETVFDPAVMRDRSSWWDESTMDYRFASIWYKLGQYIDIGGSRDAL